MLPAMPAFDKHGFDQMASDTGRETFSLQEYYAFEFSPSAPEPATLMLPAAAAAPVVLRRRWRR